MKLSADTRETYVNIIITAIENPYLGDWMEVRKYKWFSPDLEGGSAEPGPDNTPNAYAILRDTESSDEVIDFTFDVAAVSKARGVMRKIIKDGGRYAGTAKYLEDEIKSEDPDLDAIDALNVLQFAMFGTLVYG